MDQHILAHFRKVNVVLTSFREFIGQHVMENDQHVKDKRNFLMKDEVKCLVLKLLSRKSYSRN